MFTFSSRACIVCHVKWILLNRNLWFNGIQEKDDSDFLVLQFLFIDSIYVSFCVELHFQFFSVCVCTVW